MLKVGVYVLVFLILISFVSAVDYTPTIRADWLYVNTGSFIDSSPNFWERNVKISSGGVDLIKFENLGIISSNDDRVLYGARTTFGFEVTMHTDVDFRAIYPNINLNAKYAEPFFTVTRMYFGSDTRTVYTVSWNTINTGTMRQHNYDGSIPVTVGIRDILGNDGTITIGDETFNTPGYVADIVRTKVINVKSGNVGEYTDRFTNVADVKKGSVTFKELDDDFTASESKVIAYFQNSNLGWTAGAVRRGQTIQQSVIGSSQTGTEFPSRSIGETATFNLNARIQPEVYEYVQYNKIRYGTIRYWTWGFFAGNIDTLVGPAEKSAPKRVTAIHTTNSFIHWDFEVTVEFVATVDSTASLTQSILADPYLKAGDMIWDTSFTGDYKVDVPLQKETLGDIFSGLFGGLFGNVRNILIIVAVIAVSVVILYIALKLRKRKRGGVAIKIVK